MNQESSRKLERSFSFKMYICIYMKYEQLNVVDAILKCRGPIPGMPPRGMPPPGFGMQRPPGMHPAPIPQFRGPNNQVNQQRIPVNYLSNAVGSYIRSAKASLELEQAIRPPMFPNMMPPPELLNPPGVDHPIQGSAMWNANHAGAMPMGPIPAYMPMNAKPPEQTGPEKDSLTKDEEEYKKASEEARAWKEYKAGKKSSVD